MTDQQMVNFDGKAYEPEHDQARLSNQIHRVFTLMSDGEWRTLGEIHDEVNSPEASVSAFLRDFRKKRWGFNTVDKRRRGDPTQGLWEYRLTLAKPEALVQKTLF